MVLPVNSFSQIYSVVGLFCLFCLFVLVSTNTSTPSVKLCFAKEG